MKKLLMAMFALALLTACSSEPPKPAEKPQPKPADLLMARSALQKLYISAHGWAPDARPYRLESSSNADSKGRDGKSAVWRASFASASQRATKPYVWSGSDPDRGVNPGLQDTYNPNNASTHAFDIAFLKVDSDKAFEVAQQHGGDKVLAKSADTPILYILEWDVVANELVYHVIYGNSRDDYKLKIAVNATSGDFIRVEKSWLAPPSSCSLAVPTAGAPDSHPFLGRSPARRCPRFASAFWTLTWATLLLSRILAGLRSLRITRL